MAGLVMLRRPWSDEGSAPRHSLPVPRHGRIGPELAPRQPTHRVPPDDLKQAATVLAAFVYDAAMADERLPRKPLPAPTGGRGRGSL